MAKPRVLFNASVILSGLASPTGGSGKLLRWVDQGNIEGIISEIIMDEVMRHRAKVGVTVSSVRTCMRRFMVARAPQITAVRLYEKVVVDVGDAHVLASAKEHHADFLVTLDKHHLLVLRRKIRTFSIVTPKELISLQGESL